MIEGGGIIVDRLTQLREINEKQNVKVYSIYEECFKTYGRVLTEYDFSELIQYMEIKSEMPETGNIYKASVEEMEQTEIAKKIRNQFYGQMEIEVGYCNGKNSTFNGMEYHKGSEINIAVTDFMLILGHIWDIQNNTYRVEQSEVFFLEKGDAVELYQTTLHLSPCKVQEDGFKGIVILPKGTNTPLEGEKQQIEPIDRLLLQKNKWVISHPSREPLMKQGAFPGIIGKNIELFY